MKPRRLFLAAATLVALALFVLGASQAATPGSGTVSTSNPLVTWTGDFQPPTAGSCSGPNDPTCDNYRLTIQAPSSPFTVKIELQPFGDWDLYVFAPDGSLAGSSGNGPNVTEVVALGNPAS